MAYKIDVHDRVRIILSVSGYNCIYGKTAP